MGMDRGFQQKQSNKGNISAVSQSELPSKAEIKKIIAEGDVDLLVEWADRIGKILKDQKLTTSQIRNVFGTVRQIQMGWKNDPKRSYCEAVLLRPKLGYFAVREKRAKGKNKSDGMETLQKVLDPALELLSEANISKDQQSERFERFVEFFEAIVAYHKSHGGSE